MTDSKHEIADITNDPVLQLILTGQARNLDEAEELYLDQSLPVVIHLIGSSQSNSEIEQHPLLRLLRSRGMRGREDSLL